jgi:predicted membrane protein
MMKSQSLRTPLTRIAVWAIAAVVIYGLGTVTISITRVVQDRRAS